MNLNLLLGPVGSGKTDRALDTLLRLKADRPLAAVWALMATERQITAFRSRLLGSGRGYLHISFFNFQMLYGHLVQSAGSPRRVLHSAVRAALLRELLRERWGMQGAVFRPLPGFVEVIAALIDELKGWLITPEQFAGSVGADPKLAELAVIYRLYQRKLDDLRLLDREGLGVLALDLVRQRPNLPAPVDWLLVDGFDQFNPLHAALIAELARRAGETTVTLTSVDGRAGESAYSRFTLALDRLRGAYRLAQGLPEAGPDDGDLIIERLATRDNTEPGRRAVRHLAAQLWSPLPERAPAPENNSAGLVGPGINQLEAPDPASETAAVLRRVKALLLGAAGTGPACRPDDILIAVRDWGRYGPHLHTFGARYKLPLALHQGAPLAENPAVAAFLRLLALPEGGYRRQDVIDALNTPYLRLPELQDDGLKALEIAGRESFVIGGRDEWRAVLAAGRGSARREDDEEERPPLVAPGMAQRTLSALDRLFDALEMAGVSSTAGFVERLDALIGDDEPEDLPLEQTDAAESVGYSLGLLAAVRADPDAGRRARDLKAVAALKQALAGLRSAAALLAGLGITTRDQVTQADVLADLRREIAGTTLDDAQGRDGRVLATTVADARGLPHRHVFILGLSEGIFPAPIPEDPLLLESERKALKEGGLPVALRAERSDETGLFYELAGLAGDTLTLSRPILRDGAPWIESALWRTAEAAFTGLHKTTLKVGAVTPATEAATRDEAALAIADAGASLPPLENALAGWLANTDAAGWARLRHAYEVEASRLSRRAPYDRFAGRLGERDLIAELAGRFGADYPWSASQLNTLGECGFRFFALRLLGMEALDPPQMGLDVLQRGTLYHSILERTYGRIRDEGLTLTPDHLERALTVLDEEAEAAFARAPAELGFRPRPGWAQEQARMRQQAADLVRADFEGGVVAKVLESAPAGEAGARRVALLEHSYDAPLLLKLANGQPVRVRGRFDRIDRQGGRWLVVDYKSGGTTIPTKKTVDGRNFQMMIYLLALRAQQPEGAVGGFFWHLPNQTASGVLWLDTGEGDEVVTQGADHITRRIAEVQVGDFSVEPNGLEEGSCSRYCEVQALCRMTIMPRRKPYPEAAP